MSAQTTADGLILGGLDGSHPVAFLAAVGALRSLALALNPRVSLRWRITGGAWRPELRSPEHLTESIALDGLETAVARMKGHPALARWDNLSVPPNDYRDYALGAAAAASAGDRSWADFAAAFACEATTTKGAKGPIVQDTALRTMGGAGHQDFVGFMRNIANGVTREHLRKALFTTWTYDDPAQNLTLRWDPADDVRHALRWRDPSGDPTRKSGGTMLGANRLAIEALPLLPVSPQGTRLATTGFRGIGRRDMLWSWPIWEGPASVDVCRTLLALEDLVADRPDVVGLRAIGIAAVYRSQRITEGKFRNFTPARLVA